MNLTRSILIAGALALVPAIGIAQAPVANPAPAAIQAGTYGVETNHTRVQFSVSHMGFSDWYGDFTGVQGTLKLDPKALAKSSVTVTIPVASVSTTNATLDGELKDAAWFECGQVPDDHLRQHQGNPHRTTHRADYRQPDVPRCDPAGGPQGQFPGQRD